MKPIFNALQSPFLVFYKVHFTEFLRCSFILILVADFCNFVLSILWFQRMPLTLMKCIHLLSELHCSIIGFFLRFDILIAILVHWNPAWSVQLDLFHIYDRRETKEHSCFTFFDSSISLRIRPEDFIRLSKLIVGVFCGTNLWREHPEVFVCYCLSSVSWTKPVCYLPVAGLEVCSSLSHFNFTRSSSELRKTHSFSKVFINKLCTALSSNRGAPEKGRSVPGLYGNGIVLQARARICHHSLELHDSSWLSQDIVSSRSIHWYVGTTTHLVELSRYFSNQCIHPTREWNKTNGERTQTHLDEQLERLPIHTNRQSFGTLG